MFTFSSQPSIAAFYDGKTITVIVAAGAGGGLTRSCQAFVNFMPKHIAGNPKMIIKNMPGAGGTIGLKRYDPGKFQLIGAGDTTYVTLMRSDTPPGIKKPADLLKASGFKVGGRSPVSGLDLFSRMPLAVLGTKYIYVPGYTAQPKMNAAIRAKEIQYLTTGHQGYRAFYENTLLKTGEATALYYHSPLDAQGKPGKVDRYPSNIKQFVNFYKDIYGKMPSGPMWEAYKWMSTYVIWPFLMVTPEGVPKEAVSELRKAHVATTKDPEYQKAYLKAYGVMPTWLTGEEGQWLLKNYKNISPEGLEGLKQLTKTKKKK
jgi:hypothetical protein